VRIYRELVRPLLFRVDPERAHDAAVRTAELAGGSRLLVRAVASRRPDFDPRLEVTVAGLRMRSPLGLAAGFDKSARAVPLLSALGFGHVEVGSISAEPSGGNPRPRLSRLPGERAIAVAYGVPNDGAERVAARLEGVSRTVPLGINVVSTNRGEASDVEPDDAVTGDYMASVARLQDLGDYMCLNLSCPNTRDGRGFFADRARLRALLERLGEAGVRRPLFIKVAPFAGAGDVDSFLEAVDGAAFVSGFSVNLPPGTRPGVKGAISGPPAAAAAERTVAELYRRMDRTRHVVIGSGGVFTAADAYRMIGLGAALVQLYTALVYEGPGVVERITEGLAELIERDGLATIGDAVGQSARTTS
jgi:dihydroorotate dehydrogenase (fumarate)/dihydroorotate dehydrogenase